MTKKYIKIVIAGDGGVGKTTLLKRYTTPANEYNFNEEEKLTRGYDFFIKDVNINGVNYSLTLWDLGGQNQFKSIHNNCAFLLGTEGALLLFDLTRFHSFADIYFWLDLLHNYGDFPILIVGSKFDMINNFPSVYDKQVLSLLKNSKNCLGYIKTSAKENMNIDASFILLLNKIISSNMKPIIQGDFILHNKIFEEKHFPYE